LGFHFHSAFGLAAASLSNEGGRAGCGLTDRESVSGKPEGFHTTARPYWKSAFVRAVKPDADAQHTRNIALNYSFVNMGMKIK
jgi:hypothetical protein